MARPSVMTEDVLRKLEESFTWGCTDAEACCYAGIGMSTLYDYCQKNEAFSDRKETLKNMPVMKARRIIGASLDGDDLNTANRVVDRKDGQKISQVTVEMSHEQWLDTLE